MVNPGHTFRLFLRECHECDVWASVCGNRAGALDLSACRRVNVSSPAQSELRLVCAARLIEMHCRSPSPAGSEAVAIVHDPAATGPQGEDGYSLTGKVPLSADKR